MDDEVTTEPFEDDLTVIYHRSGLDAVYRAGREDWFLAHRNVRALLESAWAEGAEYALTRISNGYDSAILSDNPYRPPAVAGTNPKGGDNA